MKARRAGQAHQEHVDQLQKKGSEMKSKAKSGLKSMIKKRKPMKKCFSWGCQRAQENE